MQLKIYSNEKEMFFKMDKKTQVITPKFKNDKVIDYNITYNWDGENIYKLTNRLNNITKEFWVLEIETYNIRLCKFNMDNLKSIDRSYNQYFYIDSTEYFDIQNERIGCNFYLDQRYYDDIPEQIKNIILKNIFYYHEKENK